MFLAKAAAKANPGASAGGHKIILQDLHTAVVSDAIAAGFRDRDQTHRRLLEQTVRMYPSLSTIGLKVEFEDDPAGFRARHGSLPHQFLRVRPPDHTDVAMPSDGSEIIGYVRDAATGEAVCVERDRLTAPLRGSRGRFRWNNEPVLRTHLTDAAISPNGLVLLGDDGVLDPEFANIPNRSGSAYDRYVLGSYPEIEAAGDRSIVMRKFPESAVESGVLLTGLPNMGNFGHFIFNGVSKFPVIRDQVDAGWDVVVPAKRSPFHDAIVTYCGLDPARFVFTEGDRGIRARQLEVIAEAPMGMWPYNLLAALRAELPRAQSAERGRRIYLSRPENARRILANEEALISLLTEFEFEIVRPEILPFSEQIAALESADTIIAPHGSALASLVFCHGAKRIIEIETKTSYRMALYNFLGHEAVRLPSEAVHAQTARSGAPINFFHPDNVRYQVDLSLVRQALEWAVRR